MIAVSSPYMYRLRINVPGMVKLCNARGVHLERADRGYMAHVAISEVFGDMTPSVFSVRSEDRNGLTVLAYGERPLEEVRMQASMFAAPEAYNVLNWAESAEKPMPQAWPEGMRLRFEVRASPVVRVGRNNARFAEGAEVDVFDVRCAEAGPEVALVREDIYADWVSKQMLYRADAHVESVQKMQVRVDDLYRRGGTGRGRPGWVLRRPVIEAEGILTTGSPEGTQRLIMRGVGRHRTFGLGMVLLLPA
jgi:CRISPR system Cascade subunit CasE